MNQYLEEAAALLRKAAEENEKRFRGDGLNSTRDDLIAGRERIALKFAQLGAIEAGAIPAEWVRDLLSAGEVSE